MPSDQSAPVVVAGAGIAGLTAALAFAAHGFRVRIFERSPEFREIGAGLQLSPNATRLLDRLGVLDDLQEDAVRPEAVVLRDAASLRELGRVALGAFAKKRWGAPYLVVHRSDLQNALLAAVARQAAISVHTNSGLRDISVDAGNAVIDVKTASGVETVRCQLIIGADGVWSRLRAQVGGSAARFAGYTAWRRTLNADDPLVSELFTDRTVDALLHPDFHLIGYPVSAGSKINVVAFTPGKEVVEQDWAAASRFSQLQTVLSGTPLAAMATRESDWTSWPAYSVAGDLSWVKGGHLALIGDAAHAMTPFAAQGAAMAIEDAYTLAAHVAGNRSDRAGALRVWEAARRPRIARVSRRGAFNHFVWNAAGPAAWGRNLALRLRSPERMAADLDWLYGWQP